MTRVLADTDIFISAVMFGLPGAFLDLAILGALTLTPSPVLLDELDEKLRLKFLLDAEDAAAIRAKLESIAELVAPSVVVSVVKDDPDDDRVLECAVTGTSRLRRERRPTSAHTPALRGHADHDRPTVPRSDRNRTSRYRPMRCHPRRPTTAGQR